MTNQQFRRDYWVKGARKLGAAQQQAQQRAIRVVLVQPRAEVKMSVNAALGTVTLQTEIYVPVLDALQAHQIMTIGELEQQLKVVGIGLAKLAQAILVLMGSGAVALAQDPQSVVAARLKTDALNAYICEQARNHGEIAYLASPVTGGAMGVGRFQQLFLQAIMDGKQQPAQWAQSVWEILLAQSQRLVKDGKQLNSTEDNMAELIRQAEDFKTKHLPILKALLIT